LWHRAVFGDPTYADAILDRLISGIRADPKQSASAAPNFAASTHGSAIFRRAGD
jgi:hypothetical protein